MYYFELVLQGLIYGSMYALMALGLTLIYGLMRILHIAHAAVFSLGAYVAVAATNATGILWIGVLAAILVAALTGVLINRGLYEPLLGKPPLVPLIASVGLTIFSEDALRLVFGNLGLSFESNPWLYESIHVMGLSVGFLPLTMLVIAAVLLGSFALFLRLTRTGKAWRATLSNQQMATSFGIDIRRVRDINFALGSALAGVSGVLIALINNYVEPSMGLVVGYKALTVIVLGGLGSMTGALIGSLLLGVTESFGTIYLAQILDRDAIAAIVLIVVLVLSPRGLLGRKI